MSRIGITYQDVATAAVTVQGHDQIPTVDRVREILRTGSKTTIARHLKEWKIKSEYIYGSDGVPEELIAIVKGLWDRINNEADQKITRHQQEADNCIVEIQHAYTKEQQHNTELLAEVRQLQEKLHQQTKIANEFQLLLEEERHSTTKLTERNHSLMQQNNDQKNEATRLHQLLSHVQANLEHYQGAMQKLREEQAVSIENQRVTHERETISLKQELAEILKQRNHLHREVDQLNTELRLLTNQHNAAVEEKNLAYAQIQEKTIHEASLQSRCERLDTACNEYLNTMAKQIEVINSHDKHIAVLTDQLNRTSLSLENAQSTISMLRDEKLFLAQEKAHLQGQLSLLEKSA